MSDLPEIRLVASDALPPGTVLVFAEPSKAERQLMRGMDIDESAEFLAHAGRVAVAKNVGGSK